MKPLLAHIYEPHRVTYPCRGQRKLNGIRGLGQGGCFQSREEMPFGAHVAHLGERVKKIFGSRPITDGEFYLHGWPLQRINGATTPIRQSEKDDTKSIQYHVFDIVDYNKSFEERYATIPEFEDDFIKVVPVTVLHDEVGADLFYADCVTALYEGMIYRLGDCPYTVPKQHWAKAGRFWNVAKPRSNYLSDQDNRTWHMLKRKDWRDAEFRIVEVEEGQDKYREMAGALICLTPEGRRFAVGSGLSDAERQKYFDHPELVLGKLAKVKYLVLSQDGIPLNPTLLCIL